MIRDVCYAPAVSYVRADDRNIAVDFPYLCPSPAVASVLALKRLDLGCTQRQGLLRVSSTLHLQDYQGVPAAGPLSRSHMVRVDETERCDMIR